MRNRSKETRGGTETGDRSLEQSNEIKEVRTNVKVTSVLIEIVHFQNVGICRWCRKKSV